MGVFFEPLEVTQNARLDLGLDPVRGGALLAWTLAWLAVALGLRLLGLPRPCAPWCRGDPCRWRLQ